MVAVAAAGLLSLRRPADDPKALPVLGQVPPFTLIERSGQPLARADLDGRPWVADFIFTRCSGICPVLSTRMVDLQRQAREAGLDARMVSFSVDPSHDTPEVLRDYAARFAAVDDSWLFVTGDRGAMHELIGKGFRLSVAERDPATADDGGELITHSDRLVLVDAEGRIRGYYHGTEADSVPAVLRDLLTLRKP
ncbi:MAG: SCO family protein [Candidatus Binatia bacterium]